MKKKKSDQLAPKIPPYQPTEQELTKLREHQARKAADTTPRMKVFKAGEAVMVSPDHPDQKVAYVLLMEALGTNDLDFVHGLIGHMIAAAGGGADQAGINFFLAVIKGLKPKDQIEAMLAMQMAAIHRLTMMNAELLYRTETAQHQNFTLSGLNKCARTFAMLIEALKRYRTGGQQTVTVQHVSVGEGGQAIVGNVTQAVPGAASKKSRQSAQSAPAVTDARQSAMPIIENPARAPVAAQRRRKDEEK
jgi:hypothetical protein